MFSSTVICGTSENSWNTALMPSSRACCTESQLDRLRREADLAGCRPGRPGEDREISVDLPAPFSPNRTCTSPAFRSKSTSVEREHAGILLGQRRLRQQQRRGGLIERGRRACRSSPVIGAERVRPALTPRVNTGLKPSGASVDEVSKSFDVVLRRPRTAPGRHASDSPCPPGSAPPDRWRSGPG